MMALIPDAEPRVTIIEVGARDGLQRVKTFVPTAQKIALIDALSKTGLRHIQVASFVHPTRVVQMADAEAVCAGIRRCDGVTYSGLVLNTRGLERLHTAGLAAVDLSLSASDAHSQDNVGKRHSDAWNEMRTMVELAQRYSLRVRCGVQCAFGSYANDVTDAHVIGLVEKLLGLNIDELGLADTAGMAHPLQVQQLYAAVHERAGQIPVILHLHDTCGLGLVNLVAALGAGCRHFDTAFGGLGGCNFIPDASGNVATEDTLCTCLTNSDGKRA